MDECRKEFEVWLLSERKALTQNAIYEDREGKGYDRFQSDWITWQAAWNRRADSAQVATLAAQNRELRDALDWLHRTFLNNDDDYAGTKQFEAAQKALKKGNKE